jgi:hypothetical protein
MFIRIHEIDSGHTRNVTPAEAEVGFHAFHTYL